MDKYEKLYKDALAWMRELYPGLHGATKEDAEHYFPELRENEDERIREELMQFCDDASKSKTRVVSAEKEKQKEQKPAEKQDYSGMNDLERAILRGFLAAGVENVPVGIIKDTASECMGFLALIEPKPAEWSEEDEKILNELLDHCNTENATWYDWLNSLRPPFKDREMKLKILKYLSTRCSSLEFEEVEDYLNNLRPSWKPSEEQICSLEYFIKLWGDSDGQLKYVKVFNDVKSLCEQLKKL